MNKKCPIFGWKRRSLNRRSEAPLRSGFSHGGPRILRPPMARGWIEKVRCSAYLLVPGIIMLAGTAASAQKAAATPDVVAITETATAPATAPGAETMATPNAAPVVETATPTQTPPAASDHGIYGHIVFGGGHDSLSAYSGDMEFSLGYDYHGLEGEAGVPIYWLSTVSSVGNTGVSSLSNRYGSLGDVFLKLEFSPDIDIFDYTASVTGTLPTGAANITAGRGTWDWNNRFQHSLWRPFNPFGEIVFGDVLPVSTRVVAIPGVLSQLRAGDTIKLFHAIHVDALFYEAMPVSGQGANAVVTPLHRTIQLSDHGFMASLIASRSRWDFDLSYQRSISNRLDAVWAAVGYRLGHVRRE